MKGFFTSLAACLVLTTYTTGDARAQSIPSGESVTIRECLVIEGSDWYRSAAEIDPIEFDMVLNDWAHPVVGEPVVFDESETRQWRHITADDDGWLRDEALEGGYAYVSIESAKERVVILEAMAHRLVYVNNELRMGNLYQYKEEWESWEPHFNYSHLPVLLRRGDNDLLFQGGRIPRLKVLIHEPRADVMINENDATLPDAIVGRKIDDWASVVLINATTEPQADLLLVSRVGGNRPVTNELPALLPLSIRKAAFRLEGQAPLQPGTVPLSLTLIRSASNSDKAIDKRELSLHIKQPTANHKRTFISSIDGSVQYFSVNPAQDEESYPHPALFLSVHGAGVEAINQSGSYKAKSWGHIISPTNRRPYGFNWEDWGRIDALEVLDIALNTLHNDPERIYLTGHSMGGHGTWHLGALYPDRFAALGPSAGWISFWSYRPSREITPDSPMQKILMRATLPSRTFELIRNYNEDGIYILHGADDDNVPADESRQMAARLGTFHEDFIYHEEPGAGHWWDKNDEDGADCVDWPMMFDFFARHVRAGRERVRHVDFQTPNPGITAWNHWLCIEAQTRQLEMSSAEVRFDPGKRRFIGSTDNVARLVLDVSHIVDGDSVLLEMDGCTIGPIPYPAASRKLTLYHEHDRWRSDEAAPPSRKGPHRYGTFKDAFNHHVVFVFGSKGSAEENKWAFAKSRFDAETFWYQGNGSIDVIRDVDFDPSSDPDRSVVLYGNAETNAAWHALLADSPVQVFPGEIQIGTKKITSNTLGILMIRPRPSSDTACVGVVGGTGVTGMRLTDRRPYLHPGFAYPDLVVFGVTEAERGGDIVRAAGFFGLDWSVEAGEFVRPDSAADLR